MTARILKIGILAACAGVFLASAGWSQPQNKGGVPVVVQQPDAERTKQELSELLQRYPPNVQRVLALDPALLSNQGYLEPYPALASFLNEHPEIARTPSFYLGNPGSPPPNRDAATQIMENTLAALAVFAGFGMAIGLLVWLIRTLVDYRRWSRLATVQTEVHTKLLDRFTANNDLLAYIQSPAGAKFLESAPITLDGAPRSVGAPLGRILWSVQGGVVLIAGGVGLQFVSTQVASAAADPLHALGIIAIALGLGFVVSAVISYVISRRLGLIEQTSSATRAELPGA